MILGFIQTKADKEKVRILDEGIMSVQEILATGHVWRTNYSPKVTELAIKICETVDILDDGGYYIEVEGEKKFLPLNSESRMALVKELGETTKTYDKLKSKEEEEGDKIYAEITDEERKTYNQTLESFVKTRIALTDTKDIPNWVNTIFGAVIKTGALCAGWVITRKLLDEGELDKQSSNFLNSATKLF